jgi:hypothetical protein
VSVNAGALVLMYKQGASTYAFTLGRASVGLTASRGGTLGDVGLPPMPAGSAPAASGPGSVVNAPLGSTGAQGISPEAPAPLRSPSVLATVASAAVALSHGATGLATAGLLLVAGVLVAGMKRLPDRVLAVTDAECEEWPA